GRFRLRWICTGRFMSIGRWLCLSYSPRSGHRFTIRIWIRRKQILLRRGQQGVHRAAVLLSVEVPAQDLAEAGSVENAELCVSLQTVRIRLNLAFLMQILLAYLLLGPAPLTIPAVVA